MSGFAVAVWLSVISAVCYAAAAVVQQRLAASLPPSASSLVAVRHRRWWFAVGLTCAGAAFHAVALRYGPLTVVQPLGTLTLVLALPLGAAVTARKVTTAERRGAAATIVGLVGLLALTAAAAPVHALSTREVVLVGAVAGATLLALVATAARTAQPAARALLYAAGAGIASGVASGLAQTIVVRLTQQGLDVLFGPAAVLVLGLATAGLLLSQAAYRGSGLGAPLAMSTLANPIAAAAIGVVLLGEGQINGPAGALFAVVAAIVAGYGVALLARAAPEAERRQDRTTGDGISPVPAPRSASAPGPRRRLLGRGVAGPRPRRARLIVRCGRRRDAGAVNQIASTQAPAAKVDADLCAGGSPAGRS